MTIPFVTAYGPKNRVSVETRGPSKTKQAFKDECDINNILRKFQKTGLLEHAREHKGQYGDFAEVDFHQAMNTVRAAEAMFLSVPANIRKKFNNDPGEFLQFVNNEKNREEMYELGLAIRPVVREDRANAPSPSSPADPSSASAGEDPAPVNPPSAV